MHYVDDQGLGGPPLPPGLAGVSAIREEGSLDGAFDNVSVTAIPEPGSCVLAVVGLAVLASFRRSNVLNQDGTLSSLDVLCPKQTSRRSAT